MAGNEAGGEDASEAGSATVEEAGERADGERGDGERADGERAEDRDGERAEDEDGDDSRGLEGSLDNGDVGVEAVADDAETPAGRRWTLESHDVQFKLPPDASEDEAAAIAAAIGAQLLDERDEEPDGDDSDDTWDGRRFAFAGRIEGLTGIPRRIPRNAPTDSWTAMDRLDRI